MGKPVTRFPGSSRGRGDGMSRAVGREMENIDLRSFSFSSMKNHPKTITMKDVSRVPGPRASL